MSLFHVLALLLTLAATFAYANHRWVKLPPSIALMAMSLTLSLGLIALDAIGWVPLERSVGRVVEHIDLNEALMHGMLGALLFAGALHVRVDQLRDQLARVIGLAIVGTIASTIVAGVLLFALARVLGLPLDLGYALLFGALIAPTDPVAVLGVLRSARVRKTLETQIAGESLFNDGVGVVLFTVIAGTITAGQTVSIGAVVELFFREAVGGILFGAGSGYLVYRLLRSIDHYQTELLLTLALVLGGYALAERLHVSAPIAAVVAGLVIGNSGRAHGMSDVTRDHLDKFWDLIDEVLNAILFVLVGFEVIHISVHGAQLVAGLLAIVIVLIARAAGVALPLVGLRRWQPVERGEIPILTWGGLRGAISIALALSVTPSPARTILVSTTYIIVVFSVLVQGLTLGRVARRYA